MQGSFVRRWIITAGLAVLALAAGCSVALKLTYNQGPTLMYWYMDNYIDFDDQQGPRVKQLIGMWFDWNRREELPDYVRMLQRAGAQVTDPVVSPQQMCGLAEEVKQKMIDGFEQAVPSLAEVAITLTPDQARNLQKRFEKNDAKFRDDFLGPRREDRLKALTKKAEERLAMVYGSVDDAQHERLLQLEAASPYDPELWLQERQAMRQEVLQALRSLIAEREAGTPRPQLTAQAQAALRQIARDDAASPRPYRALQQRVWDYNCGLAAQMHNSMSASQRQAAQRKLAGWEEDLRALHAGR